MHPMGVRSFSISGTILDVSNGWSGLKAIFGDMENWKVKYPPWNWQLAPENRPSMAETQKESSVPSTIFQGLS